MSTQPNCPHCPDGHSDPESRPWAVYVTQHRDGDGQPTSLHASPTGGQHVAESDAEWARRRLNTTVTVKDIAKIIDPTAYYGYPEIIYRSYPTETVSQTRARLYEEVMELAQEVLDLFS